MEGAVKQPCLRYDLADGCERSLVLVASVPLSSDEEWRPLSEGELMLAMTAAAVTRALLVGLGLALLANLPFKRRWPVRLALLLPWALPLVFAGLTPSLDGSLTGWLRWLAQPPSPLPHRIVPGPGPVETEWDRGTAPQAAAIG